MPTAITTRRYAISDFGILQIKKISRIGISNFSTYLEAMDIEATRKIGKKLRTLRRKKGLTQEQLAANLNKPQSYISKLESGEKSLHVYEVFHYADALEIHRADLLGEIELTLTNRRSIFHGPSVEFSAIQLLEESPDRNKPLPE